MVRPIRHARRTAIVHRTSTFSFNNRRPIKQLFWILHRFFCSVLFCLVEINRVCLFVCRKKVFDVAVRRHISCARRASSVRHRLRRTSVRSAASVAKARSRRRPVRYSRHAPRPASARRTTTSSVYYWSCSHSFSSSSHTSFDFSVWNELSFYFLFFNKKKLTIHFFVQRYTKVIRARQYSMQQHEKKELAKEAEKQAHDEDAERGLERISAIEKIGLDRYQVFVEGLLCLWITIIVFVRLFLLLLWLKRFNVLIFLILICIF